jgi:four helix bundle protein
VRSDREKAETFRDLIVWQKAHEFVIGIYRFTVGFPKSEAFGLTQQLRRAAVSIPANIAEGFKRSGKQDKARFMNIAAASLEECRYYLILAMDLNYSNAINLTKLGDEVGRLLHSYSRAILSPVSCILSSS